ncbi:MAG TPA: nucleotidyltransferase [Minicystis sp.]|nr:nucleotidyltransferase [Minicystis sp.]
MTRARGPRDDVLAAIRDVFAALRDARRRAMLVGGVAVIANGVERTTKDVDVCVEGPGTDLEQLLEALRARGIVPRIRDALAFARANLVMLLVHERSGVPVDLSLGWAPFELRAIASARRVRFGRVAAPVAGPEDLVVYKVVAHRPHDLRDAEQLLVLHARVDVDRVRRDVRALCDELGDDTPAVELEKLLARTTRLPARPARAAKTRREKAGSRPRR